MTSSHDKSLRSPLLPTTQQHLARALNSSGTLSRIITETYSKPSGLLGETGTPSIPLQSIGPLPSPEISQIQFLMGARTIFHQQIVPRAGCLAIPLSCADPHSASTAHFSRPFPSHIPSWGNDGYLGSGLGEKVTSSPESDHTQ